MISLDERIKILEDKVLKLEGGNRIKEDSGGPYKDSLTEK